MMTPASLIEINEACGGRISCTDNRVVSDGPA